MIEILLTRTNGKRFFAFWRTWPSKYYPDKRSYEVVLNLIPGIFGFYVGLILPNVQSSVQSMRNENVG